MIKEKLSQLVDNKSFSLTPALSANHRENGCDVPKVLASSLLLSPPREERAISVGAVNAETTAQFFQLAGSIAPSPQGRGPG